MTSINNCASPLIRQIGSFLDDRSLALFSSTSKQIQEFTDPLWYERFKNLGDSRAYQNASWYSWENYRIKYCGVLNIEHTLKHMDWKGILTGDEDMEQRRLKGVTYFTEPVDIRPSKPPTELMMISNKIEEGLIVTRFWGKTWEFYRPRKFYLFNAPGYDCPKEYQWPCAHGGFCTIIRDRNFPNITAFGIAPDEEDRAEIIIKIKNVYKDIRSGKIRDKTNPLTNIRAHVAVAVAAVAMKCLLNLLG